MRVIAEVLNGIAVCWRVSLPAETKDAQAPWVFSTRRASANQGGNPPSLSQLVKIKAVLITAIQDPGEPIGAMQVVMLCALV
jgi:hypothetical protein